MTALIGTATGAPTLLEDFMHVELEVIGACRTALTVLRGLDERALVAGLRDEHQEALRHLRRLTMRYHVECPEDGTVNEARTLGRIKLAARRGGDAQVLDALDVALAQAAVAYARGLRNAALPEAMVPILTASSTNVERHRVALRRAVTLAA
jgi:ribosomal protein S9